MKTTSEQLAGLLIKELHPVYLISGDEILLIEETVELIRQSIQKKHVLERKSYQVDTHFNWPLLFESVNNSSLFSEKTLIELRIPSGKINEKGQGPLMQYLDKPSKSNIIIITTSKLDGNTQKTKWFKAIDKTGIFVPIWPLTQKQLYYWIQKRLRHYQIEVDASVIQLIADYAEGNPLAAKQEIEKLRLLYDGKKRLTHEEVISLIGDNSHYNTFALNDAVLEGNAKRALHILNKLQEEGVEPILILWSLTREIRTLVEIAQQLEKGNTIETILSKKFILEKQKPLIRSGLKRHNSSSLLNLLHRATQVDHMIKGLKTGNIQDELRKVSLGLCGYMY